MTCKRAVRPRTACNLRAFDGHSIIIAQLADARPHDPERGAIVAKDCA
jgi:hypothetical protein